MNRLLLVATAGAPLEAIEPDEIDVGRQPVRQIRNRASGDDGDPPQPGDQLDEKIGHGGAGSGPVVTRHDVGQHPVEIEEQASAFGRTPERIERIGADHYPAKRSVP